MRSLHILTGHIFTNHSRGNLCASTPGLSCIDVFAKAAFTGRRLIQKRTAVIDFLQLHFGLHGRRASRGHSLPGYQLRKEGAESIFQLRGFTALQAALTSKAALMWQAVEKPEAPVRSRMNPGISFRPRRWGCLWVFHRLLDKRVAAPSRSGQ